MLLVLFRGGRRVEVVTGAAVVGALPDVWLRNMQVSAMVPHFKAGDYGAGVEAGVKAIVAKLADFEAPGAGDLLQAHYAASDRGYELEGRRFWLRQGEAGGQSQDDGSLLSPPRDARERERALSRATFGGGRQGMQNSITSKDCVPLFTRSPANINLSLSGLNFIFLVSLSSSEKHP